MGAVFHMGDDIGVNFLDVTTRDWGSFHEAVFDVAADEVFGGSDVFHAFGDGPFFGSGFEIPLCRSKVFDCGEDVFFAGLEKFESFGFICIGEQLSAGGRGTAESQE